MSIARNIKETYLEEIVDNLSGNSKDISLDCKPRNREEYLLSEIERLTRSGGGSTYNMWVGTQLEYDSILEKDANTLYFIRESE